MLTLIALSAALMQEPPAPPAPPEARTRVMVMGPNGPGGLDKDGDGQVSREEFAAPLNDHFGQLDKNGDGRLSDDELSGGRGPAGDGDVVMFRRGDDAGPGGHRIEMRRGGPDAPNVMFFRGEPGERGEHQVIIRGAGGHGGPHIIHAPGHDGPRGESQFEIRRLGEGDQHIEIRTVGGEGGHGELDKDGDGKVSEAEFTAPLRDAFARMDADRSGFIEESERGGDGDVRVFTHRIETRHSED